MKKILFILTAFAFTTAVVAQKKAADVAKFNTETFDLGKVKHNVPATATYIVTNTGTEPLIMTVTPSCGCTLSDYTKSPIAPGKSGFIKAVFDGKAMGAINKTVTVKFEGVDDVKHLKLSGEVLDAKAYDEWAAKNKSSNGTTSVKVKDDKVKTETKLNGVSTKTKTKKGKKVTDKSVVKK